MIFNRYEEIRARLPEYGDLNAEASQRMCRSASNLGDFESDIDVYLFDAFGVLNVGDTPIDGAVERVAHLQEIGKEVYVLTNAASYKEAHHIAKFDRFGFNLKPENIISSRDTLFHYINAMADGKSKFGVVSICDLADTPLKDHSTIYNREDEQTLRAFFESDILMFLSSADWTEADQKRLLVELKKNPRPVYVGNPDIVAPRETSFSIEPGFFAHQILDETDCEVHFYGKPFSNIYDFALQHVLANNPKQDLSRILMVGDTLHTDIIGGRAAGIKTALVTDYGAFANLDVDAYIKKSGILPDYIVPNI